MKGEKMNLNYPSQPKSPAANDHNNMFNFDNNMDLNQTAAELIGNDLFDYISDMPDPDVATIVCAIAQEKVRQTFAILDHFTKAIFNASKIVPGFVNQFKAAFKDTDCPARKELSVLFAQQANAAIKLLTDHISKTKDFKVNKAAFEADLQRDLKAGDGKSK